MSEEELNDFLGGVMNDEAGANEILGQAPETPQETTETISDISLSDLSNQLETTNYILSGITFFMGLAVGMAFIKILWERIK